VALINLIEPADLVVAFQSNPPEGFTPLVFVAPAFETKFDLLTTLEPAMRRRLDALPLADRWQAALRPRTSFIGTTVSEYALFPSATAPEDLVRTIVEEMTPRSRFVIVKDLPMEATLVGADAWAYSRQLTAACRAAGFVLLGGQALAYVPVDFDSTDAYLSRFSRSRRKNLRRKLRHCQTVGIDALATGDPRFADDAFVAAIYALYRNVYAQSEVHFDFLSESFFRAVLRNAAIQGILFTYRAEGALIGWNLCFVQDGMLIDKYIGFDYPISHRHDLYTISWFHNLEYALAHGLRFYVAGWTDPELKRQLGASFTPTMHAVHIRNPLLRGALKLSRRWFEPDRRWVSEFRDGPTATPKDRALAATASSPVSRRARAPGLVMRKKEPDDEQRRSPSAASATARAVVLDFDGSVAPLEGAETIALGDRQEEIRFGCGRRALDELPELGKNIRLAFLGSGDFHHVTFALIARMHRPMQVVVLDNHPDNMRYPFGIHCGSWVSHVARLPFVSQVHVAGITSRDVEGLHALENRLQPLRSGKVAYWCVGRDLTTVRRLGASAVQSFDSTRAMLDALRAAVSDEPVYLSIDKDVLAEDVVRTNWDQGVMRLEELEAAIATFRGRIVASDVTGDVSRSVYRSHFKRLLAALDRQPEIPPQLLDPWQKSHRRLNRLLLALLALRSG
jgi:uncharacterized protein